MTNNSSICLPSCPPPPLAFSLLLSCFSACSCLVIPVLSSDCCGLCPSECLLLLTSKHCSLCYRVMFSHKICILSFLKSATILSAFLSTWCFVWQGPYVVRGHHMLAGFQFLYWSNTFSLPLSLLVWLPSMFNRQQKHENKKDVSILICNLSISLRYILSPVSLFATHAFVC